MQQRKIAFFHFHLLLLPFKLEKSDVQEHLEVMFAKFMEEKKKEKASKWNWMGQLQEKS